MCAYENRQPQSEYRTRNRATLTLHQLHVLCDTITMFSSNTKHELNWDKDIL